MAEMQSILVVDDDPAVLSLITRVLMDAGYLVTPAEGPVEALELLAKHTPDLLIVDYHLPGIAGTDLLELLHGSGAGRFTPAIAITGDSSIDPDELRARGFSALLLKPFNLQQLRRTVTDFLP